MCVCAESKQKGKWANSKQLGQRLVGLGLCWTGLGSWVGRLKGLTGWVEYIWVINPFFLILL